MIWIDFVLLGIIGISMLLSLWRGFVKEAVSLASWIAALWVAMLFFHDLSTWLGRWIDTPSIRDVLGFGILFIATVLIGGMIGYLAGQLVSKTGLSATDRALGMVFGIARGIVIVAVMVMLAGLTTLPQDPWWRESLLLAHFQDVAIWLRGFLPDDVAGNIHF